MARIALVVVCGEGRRSKREGRVGASGAILAGGSDGVVNPVARP